MKYCPHTHWLNLYTRDSEVNFAYSDRAQTLLQGLPYSESQKPSLFVLIGNSRKFLALNELTPGSTRNRTALNQCHGEIHLHLDTSNNFGDRPVLFAEGDFPVSLKPSKSLSTNKCHESSDQILPGLTDAIGLERGADNLYFRLLSPFTDAYCFFASDLGGLQCIADRVASWLNLGEPSTLPLSTHPWIVIVIEGPALEFRESNSLVEFSRLLYARTRQDINAYFAGVRVLNLLPESNVSSQARHRRLKECLMSMSDQVRVARHESRTLFSALHFSRFLKHACTHFIKFSSEPFDFIRTSRLDNPPALDLTEHLTIFLTKTKTLEALHDFAIPLIASSFLLDNYPPHMHLFSPVDIFQVIYKAACHQACRLGALAHVGSTHLLLPSRFTERVEDTFLRSFENLECIAANTSVDLHRQVLSISSQDCLSIYSDDTCFVCLRRRPQYSLPCGHCICDNCIQTFGILSKDDPWLFEVKNCLFCGSNTTGVKVKVVPKTASIRVLTLDGGGVRGIAILQYLQVLEEVVGLHYPIQHNFDVIVGTSSGGIIGLDISINGSQIEESIKRFERLAKSSFQPRSYFKIPILSPILDILLLYFTDSRYSSENLDTALKGTFGTFRSMLDCSKATATGTRVAIPVTTIRDTATCVFTNYNGVGQRPRSCGYHILRPKGGLGRVPLWEIARSGSAAPSFFKPKHISGLGTFQDGGLQQNDPGNLALQEAAALYPSADEPSLVVSLGTGSRRMDEEPPMGPTRGIFRDGFIPRLIRSFLLSMNSTGGHKFRSRQKEGRREQYFRFDMEFEGPEPRLDDTTKMPELKAAARSAILGSKEVDRLARCIVAENFIFELEILPQKGDNGHYNCTGLIICRLRRNDPALEILLDRLIKTSTRAKFLLQDQTLSPMNDGSYVDRDGNFRKRVSFTTPSHSCKISIGLQEGFSNPCDISGSPFSIKSLIAAQGLEAYFGTADHIKRPNPYSLTRPPKKRQRR